MGANQGKPSRQDLIDELDGLRGQLAAEAPKRPSAPQAASSSSGVRLPGRLQDPENTMESDPRVDPSFKDMYRPFEMTGEMPGAALLDGPMVDGPDGNPMPSPGTPVTMSSSRADITRWCNEAEQGYTFLFENMLGEALFVPRNVEKREEIIKGVDGNDIKLFISTPTACGPGPFPCLYHIHGGGMAILMAEDTLYSRVRDMYAEVGFVAVGVEFRNAGGRNGPHPFPRGLNDCYSGLEWTYANKDALNANGKIIIAGESGGGNLCIATTLKAKKEGKLEMVDGVFSMCPYISGPLCYGGEDLPESKNLPSLHENNNIFLNVFDMLTVMSLAYTWNKDERNPLAWPYFATVDDVKGLPPHVISVNECDPLRDEGLAYYRKLLAAGVPCTGRIIPGTIHAGDAFPFENTRIHWEATRMATKAFADAL